MVFLASIPKGFLVLSRGMNIGQKCIIVVQYSTKRINFDSKQIMIFKLDERTLKISAI